MDTSNRKGRRGDRPPSKGWIIYFTLPIVLALLLLSGWLLLPGMRGVPAARAAGPGGSSGIVTDTLAAEFNQVCATLTGVTVTNINPDGEVRLRASLEDYFDGTAIDTSLWITGTVYTWYKTALPMVSGGLLTLDANLIRSQTLFNQSPRFVEAWARVRANTNNAANIDIGYYRNDPPAPPSPAPPITADTAVRLFLVENGGSNNLLARLVDGTQSPPTDDDITNPDLTQWHLFRIEWGETNTDYYIDGSLATTIPETNSNGDTLNARILLYHMDPTEIYTTAPMQVDWIRGGQYPASGTYTSCVFDAGGVVNFSNLSWDADVPSGAGLTIQTRTSLDNVTWSDWSSSIDARAGSSSALSNPSGRYFQYRLNFTSNLIRTAELRQIRVDYYGPTRLEVTPASATLDPGATQSFIATAFDANNQEVSGLTVNWSSAVGSITSSGLFTAPLPPGTTSNAVTASVALAGGGTLTGNATVTVRDLPPFADAGGPYNGNEGASIPLSGSGSDPNGGTVSYAWDLDNNGTFETSGQAVSGVWPDNGSYTVNLRVTDYTGQSTTTSTTVEVVNVPPTATFNAPASVNEGSPINLSLTGPSDPSSADTAAGFQYAFDCGSGYGAFGSSDSASCPTTDSGTLTVGGRIRDKDGGVREYTAQVSVNNVAPTATFNAPASVNEGSSINLSLTGSSDPSSTDTAAGFQYAFDCGSGYGAFGSSNSASCPTTDSGTLTVGGRIRDKDGGVREYTAQVTVNNIAPQITSVTNNGPVHVNQAVQIWVTVSAYSGDILTYEFDCDNDGSYEVGPQPGSAATCTFTQSGTYTVGVRVSDDDGASDSGTTDVVVNNYLIFLPLMNKQP